MNKKSLAYSGILLLSLVFASVLLSRGILHATIGSADVAVTYNATSSDTVTGASTDVALGGTAVFNGTITIGAANESIEEVTLDFTPQVSGAGKPDFKLRAQPDSASPTIVKTFNASTTPASSTTTDGMLDGTFIPGVGQVKVTITVSTVSTLPNSLPATLPGTFKGDQATSPITYLIEWTPDLCKITPNPTPCLVGDNISGTYDLAFSVKQPSLAAVAKTASATFAEQAVPTLSVTTPTASQGFGKSDLAADPPSTTTDSLAFSGSASGGVADVSVGGTSALGINLGAPFGAPTAPVTWETSDQEIDPIASATDSEWGADGLWHKTDEIKPGFPKGPYIGTFGAGFTKDPDSSPPSSSFNFSLLETPVSGGLRSPKITLGAGSEFMFETWFETEFGNFSDKKIVQWCPTPFSAGTCITLFQITDVAPFGGGDPFFFPDPFAPFPFAPIGPPPGTLFDGSEIFETPGTKFVFVPNSHFESGGPKTTKVTIELIPLLLELTSTDFTGATGHVRFFFDSLDGFGNEGYGWFVDDIVGFGPVSVTGLSFPVTPNPGWTGFYKPSEGSNTVTFQAKRTKYLVPGEFTLADTPTASSTVTFFLDSVAPTGLAYDNPDLLSVAVGNPTVAFVTSASTIQVAGEFTETLADTLVVEKRTATTTAATSIATLDAAFAASSVKPVLSLKDSNSDFAASGKTTLETATTAGASRISTTLAEASIAGATTIKVVSAAGLAANDVLKIDVRSRKEFKKIASISGDTVTLNSALSNGHASGVAVVEQETITIKADTGFAADKFIQIDKGPSAEVRRITFSTAASSTLLALDTALSYSHPAGAPVRGAEDRSFRSTQAISLDAGFNQLKVTLTDKGGQTATATVIVLRDNAAPTGTARIVTIVSDGEAKVGDEFFLLISASDGESEVSSVTEVAAGADLVLVANVEDILLEMHSLRTTVGSASTTHVRLSEVAIGTPVGANSISIKIKDTAENETTITASLNVVSKRTNRKFFLFPGTNYLGLALIPDDPSLDALMLQDVTSSVNPAFLNSTSTLGQVVKQIFGFSVITAGGFDVYVPGGPKDFSTLAPFQGLIFQTHTTSTKGTFTVDVFKKVEVTGFADVKQAVPIPVVINGTFVTLGSALPPSKVLRTGYNLIAPHILDDATFDVVYRGALIPTQTAVSAISFERRVDALAGTSSINAEIFEGFVVRSLGQLVKPVLSYFTFIVEGTPTITP